VPSNACMIAVPYRNLNLMKLFILCLMATLLIACGTGDRSTSNDTAAMSQNLPGSDRDPSGCIRSAGYTWSVAKDRCIRVWEEGSLFSKYDSGDESRANDPENVYVVLSDDKSTAELFLGGTDRPVLLDQNPILEGDVNPVLYDRDYENVKIQYRKDAYWILHDGKAIYYNYYSEQDGFNTQLK
jgi:hypothetical protein